MTGSLWSYRVVALNDGRLTNGRNSFCFIEKNKRFMILVWRLTATRQAFIFFGDNWLIDRFFINQTNAPGRKYFTPMDVQLQRKMKARLSSYQWTWGETAALLSRCPLNFSGLGGGFAPRHLNRYAFFSLLQSLGGTRNANSQE